MKKRMSCLIKRSYSEVESMYHNGLVTCDEFLAYGRVWQWIAPRFGGIAGMIQDESWNKYGKGAFCARMNKVRAAFCLAPVKC